MGGDLSGKRKQLVHRTVTTGPVSRMTLAASMHRPRTDRVIAFPSIVCHSPSWCGVSPISMARWCVCATFRPLISHCIWTNTANIERS